MNTTTETKPEVTAEARKLAQATFEPARGLYREGTTLSLEALPQRVARTKVGHLEVRFAPLKPAPGRPSGCVAALDGLALHLEQAQEGGAPIERDLQLDRTGHGWFEFVLLDEPCRLCAVDAPEPPSVSAASDDWYEELTRACPVPGCTTYRQGAFSFGIRRRSMPALLPGTPTPRAREAEAISLDASPQAVASLAAASAPSQPAEPAPAPIYFHEQRAQNELRFTAMLTRTPQGRPRVMVAVAKDSPLAAGTVTCTLGKESRTGAFRERKDRWEAELHFEQAYEEATRVEPVLIFDLPPEGGSDPARKQDRPPAA